MSIESVPDPTAQEFYTDLSDIQIDPYIRAVFQKVQDHNDLIRDEYLSSEQINEIMNELDDDWRMLLGKEATFTGLASFLPIDSVGAEGPLEKQFFEEETMRFNGVMPQQLGSKYVYDQTTDEYVEHHSYHLRLQVWREALDHNGAIVHLKGVTETEDVLSLVFTDVLSLEGARKWLAYYHANDIDDIDVDLYASGKEECEVALRLAGHSVDTDLPHRGDEMLALRSTIALNVYTNNLISFDMSAPYTITVDGEAWFPTRQGSMEPGYAGGTQLAAIDKISWLQPVGEERRIVTPHLQARLLNETKDIPDTTILIPLSAVKRMQSSRYAYYYGYDAQPVDSNPVQ